MAGENLTPEMARIIGKLQDQIDELRARQTPILVRGLNDLQDVYIDVLMRADGDVVTWVEANQDWESLPGASGGLPIVNDDGTYTQTIEDSSGRLLLKNVLNAGNVLLSRLILDTDGTAYLEAYGPEVVVYAADQGSARIQSSAHTYVKVYEETGSLQEAFLAIQNFAVGLDDGSWSAPTFYVRASGGTGQTIFAVRTPTVSGDLDPGEFGFWFDDTIGSSAINFKGKDSAGTVVTGSLALT